MYYKYFLESWFPKSVLKNLEVCGDRLRIFCENHIIPARESYKTCVISCCLVAFGLGNYLVSMAVKLAIACFDKKSDQEQDSMENTVFRRAGSPFETVSVLYTIKIFKILFYIVSSSRQFACF